MSAPGPRPPRRPSGPGHPQLGAALLVLAVLLLIVVLAAVSSFG